MIFPVLSRSLQYLHSWVLQKENPLSLLLVPKVFLGSIVGGGIEVVGVVCGTRNLSRVVFGPNVRISSSLIPCLKTIHWPL